ncbi:GPW/gp25 family protein [Actinoplanes sp. NPDC026623]|uniref:GPW/gp25 family protein n=1 Tax=Actinoplanes sp. NPDC026623 TaxID=3155610 RepID=UPI0034027BC9
MSADFLGRGWGFPVEAGPDGDVALVSAGEDVRQAVLIILQTEPGERVMRPDFGCGLRGMVFQPINTTTLALVRHRVEEALVAWEPRIDVTEVTVSADQASSGRLLIRVDYRVRATNAFYNLVYPFYLQEGAPPPELRP